MYNINRTLIKVDIYHPREGQLTQVTRSAFTNAPQAAGILTAGSPFGMVRG